MKHKTVIDGGVTKPELRKLIETHDRIIMLGHGTPDGLISVGQFLDAGYHIEKQQLTHPKTKAILHWQPLAIVILR